MTAHPALLQAILHQPDDDTPRLVYADWLDEHGEPARAELIRVQCGLARAGEEDPRQASWHERQHELLAAHQDEWKAELAPWTEQVRFGRGFIEAIAIRLEKLLDRPEELFDRAPIRMLYLTDEGSSPAELLALARKAAELPALQQLTGLHLASVELGEAVLQALLRSPYLAGLKQLFFSESDCEPSTAGVLAGCTHLESMTELYFLGDSGEGLRDEGVAVLCQCPHLARLENLDLRDNNLGAGAMRALAQSPYLSSLRGLYLGDGRHAANEIGAAGARWLGSSPNLAKLAFLHLDFNDIGNEGLAFLARSPHLASLRSLSLVRNGINGTGLESLSEVGPPWQLDKLDLSSNPIGDRGVEILARSPRLIRIGRLGLAGGQIGPAGARALIAAPWLGQLRELRLSSNPLGQEGIEVLLGEPFQGLSQLRLARYGLDPAHRQALQQHFGARFQEEMLVLPSMDARTG